MPKRLTYLDAIRANALLQQRLGSAFDKPRLEEALRLADPLPRRMIDGQETESGAHDAAGRAVARQWGVWREFRAAASDTVVDVLVLVPQGVD
jgi:hypothetical protein